MSLFSRISFFGFQSALGAALVVGLLACAPSPAPQTGPRRPATASPKPGENSGRTTGDRAPADPAEAAGTATGDQKDTSPPTGSPPGTIRRAEFNAVLARGPQAFIRKIRVRPALRRGRRFYGWRVVSYDGPGPIRPGDIVTRVNGRPVERPDQFMNVWRDLARADKLEVRLIRDGKLEVLTFPIVD